jgi:hypothetical protein
MLPKIHRSAPTYSVQNSISDTLRDCHPVIWGISRAYSDASTSGYPNSRTNRLKLNRKRNSPGEDVWGQRQNDSGRNSARDGGYDLQVNPLSGTDYLARVDGPAQAALSASHNLSPVLRVAFNEVLSRSTAVSLRPSESKCRQASLLRVYPSFNSRTLYDIFFSIH